MIFNYVGVDVQLIVTISVINDLLPEYRCFRKERRFLIIEYA